MINGLKILNGAKYFSSGIIQNYLVFIPAKKYIKYFNDTSRIYLLKSNGMSEEMIEKITKSDNFFAAIFVNNYMLLDVNLNWNCLINKNICF